MPKNRLEAFSDGVLAIIITIMVLELKAPHEGGVESLLPLLPSLLGYLLSFVYVGIYWNNHHHLFHAADKVSGAVLWANLHLLFWLSLFPFVTDWMDESHLATVPTAAYGIVLLMASLAFTLLQYTIIREQGSGSVLASALGRDYKGKVSMAFYALGIGVAFVRPALSAVLYVIVALIWFLPDRRIERKLGHGERKV